MNNTSYLSSCTSPPEKTPKEKLADMRRREKRLDAEVGKLQAELKLLRLDIEEFKETYPELEKPPTPAQLLGAVLHGKDGLSGGSS